VARGERNIAVGAAIFRLMGVVVLDLSRIGSMVRFHRKAAGISRMSLAELAGVGKTVIFEIEHGKKTVRLDRLAAVLNVLNIAPRWESPLMSRFEEQLHLAGPGNEEGGDGA